MRKIIRNLILNFASFMFLGPAGLATHSRLQLHGSGEFISEEIRQTGVHYELIALIKVWLLVRPRYFVDVGANLGNHSNFFEIKGAECIAFEPSTSNFTLLQKNLKRGVARNVALGSAHGTVEILVSPVSMGNTHIRGAIELETDHLASSEFAELRTLDSFELERVDLVKIDVEGFELEVLKGCEKLLETSKPRIWIEIHESKTLQKAKVSYTRDEIFGWLSLRGFNTRKRIDRTNFLFIHEECRRGS